MIAKLHWVAHIEADDEAIKHFLLEFVLVWKADDSFFNDADY